jgi:hypothetical protein
VPSRGHILAEPTAAPAIPIAELEDEIAALSADGRERLVHHFRPSSIRRRRIDERDRLIRELAGEILPAGARSGRELAEAVAAALRRYAARRGVSTAIERRQATHATHGCSAFCSLAGATAEPSATLFKSPLCRHDPGFCFLLN